jgi:hypothetical protein
MGADSLTTWGNEPEPGAVKIIKVEAFDVSANPGNPSLLLGFCGHAGLWDAMRADLRIDRVPGPDEDPQPWAAQVARQITEVAAAWRLLDRDGDVDGNALLGWGGRVWRLSSACARQISGGIVAVGSGGAYATGALVAIDTWPRLMGEAESVEDAVSAAVVIASHLDVRSGGTPLVLSIP